MNTNPITPRHRPLALTTLTLALFASSSAVWAQALPAPNAGQVLRDLQQTPVPGAAPSPTLPRPAAAPEAAKPGETQALVKSVLITGNSELSTAQLQPLVADVVGKPQSVSQLTAAAARITAYYRSRGFAVARAYLPAQDITAGAVTIAVVEGRISTLGVKNTSRLSDERANTYFNQIKPGEVVRSEQIDRSLLLAQDTPGVGGSRATLQPGASVGTSELLIEVSPAKAYSGNVSLDNYGNRYTGEYRAAGTFTLASPLGIGDQLSFAGLTGGNNLNFGRIAYQLPVGSDGLRVGAAYFDTRYKLGKEFDTLAATGSASSVSGFAAYPFIRSHLTNLSGTIAYEHKRLQDNVGATAIETLKTVKVSSLGLSGNRQDAMGSGGISSFDLSVALGKLRIDSPNTRAIDAASAQSGGSYVRLSYALDRLQRLSDATQLWVSVVGQQANKNLDSSEKFSLGGANGVRAYPQSEGTGDEGIRATIELRQTLFPNVQGTVFYDVGSVTINKNPFGAPMSNERNLAGVGFGLNANVAAVQLRASLAWRVDGGLPTTVPAHAARKPMLWVMAALPF